MAFEITREQITKQANELLKLFQQTRIQKYKDEEIRLRRIVVELEAFTGGSGGTPNLDQVTTAGNTTSNTIDVGGITTDYVQFDTIATPTPVVGMMSWDTDRSTVSVQLDSDVDAHLGQDNFWYVKNQSGATIPKGKAVMAVGTLGASGRILIDEMVANGSVSAKYLLGVTAEDIANGADGFVINIGKLRQIDTSMYSAGAVLYCDPSSPGNFTTTLPSAPNLKLPIAFVVHSAANGTLAIRVNIGSDLYEDHRVQVNTGSLADGQLLRYDSTDQRWENWTPNFLTSVPTLAQVTTAGNTTTNPISVSKLTVNALSDAYESAKFKSFADTYHNLISFYLADNTTSTVVLGRNGASVAYPYKTGTLASYGFVGNNYSGFHIFAGSNIAQTIHTNGNIGINTTTDAGYKLDVNGTARVSGISYLFTGTNISSVGSNDCTFSIIRPASGSTLTFTTRSNSSTQTEGVNITRTDNTWLKFIRGTTVDFNISNTGNFLVGTTTDAGYKLDVNGTARVGDASSYGDVFVVRTPGSGWSFDYQYLKIGGVLKLGLDRLQLRVNNSTAYVGNNGDSGNSSLTIMGGYNGAGTEFAPVIFGSGREASLVRETMRVDNQNQRVGIGTSTPAYKLQVQGTVSAQLTNATHTSQVYYNTTTGELTYGALPTVATPTLAQVTTAGNTTTNAVTVGGLTVTGMIEVFKVGSSVEFRSLDSNINFLGKSDNTGGVNFYGGGAYNTGGGISVTGNSNLNPSSIYFFRDAFTQNGRFFSSGNLLLGSGSTDAGYKLDVSGTIRSSGVITASGGTSTDWNAAYSWGNHATAGYLTGTTGYTGIFTVPTNPPGQQNLDIVNGLIVNVF